MQGLFHFLDRFQKLSDVEKQKIKSVCSVIKMNKNEIIEATDSIATKLYFLQSGVVRIFYYKDGIDVTEFFAFEGNLVARVQSILTKKRSAKSIQMLEAGELVAIDAAQFFQLCNDSRSIERLYRLILEDSYLSVVDRVESIQFNSVQERYTALLEHHELFQKVPLKYIASYLGITQVSLSRIRAKYREV